MWLLWNCTGHPFPVVLPTCSDHLPCHARSRETTSSIGRQVERTGAWKSVTVMIMSFSSTSVKLPKEKALTDSWYLQKKRGKLHHIGPKVGNCDLSSADFFIGVLPYKFLAFALVPNFRVLPHVAVGQKYVPKMEPW